MKYKVGDKFPYDGGYRILEEIDPDAPDGRCYSLAYYEKGARIGGENVYCTESFLTGIRAEGYIPVESEPAPKTTPNYYLVKLEDGTEVECRALMKALGLHANFDLASAFKYLWRAGKKHDNVAEDLGKASHFLQMAVADLKKSR